MFNPEQKNRQPMICNFIPGYAYYEDMSFRLAETLVNLVEWLLKQRK